MGNCAYVQWLRKRGGICFGQKNATLGGQLVVPQIALLYVWPKPSHEAFDLDQP